MTTVLIVIAILVLLIVTHELGHFVAAKIFKVRVDEFGIGYPPRAFLLAKINDTEYTINWLPFGGFVRLFGEDDNENGRGSFVRASRLKQAVILFAGVAMNAIVAWLLFSTALAIGVPRVVDDTSAAHDPSARLMVSDVIAGSPASAAGIIAGDQILALTDQNGVSDGDLTPSGVSLFVSTRGGERISVGYVHAGATTSAVVIPADAVIPGQAGKPALGVGLVEVSSIALPWYEALSEGFSDTVNAFETVCASLYQLIAGSFTGHAELSNVVGPVGLVGVVNDAAQSGIGQVLALAGFIGANLAVINLLPIPALDGGRIVIVAAEALTRRRAPVLAVQLVNTIGIALIIILMVAVTYNDIARLLA